MRQHRHAGRRKNVNLPALSPTFQYHREGSRRHLGWGVPNGIDFIAASFVGQRREVHQEVLGEEGKSIKIISKVENQEGLVNFDDILEESDGVMVAAATSGWRSRPRRLSRASS